MKTLNELYAEVTASDALKAEFLALKTPEEIVDFAKKHGCDATLDDIKAFFEEKQKAAGELSEEDLEQVAGGKSADVLEGFLSIVCSLTFCLTALVVSAATGKAGSDIEGRGSLCAVSGEHSDLTFWAKEN